MTPLWNQKHQKIVPSTFLSFFSFSSDATTDTVRDNELETEIIAIKASLDQSRYRTRLAVVLVGDESTGSAFNASDLEQRIENIRKSARLDSNNAFFLPIDVPRTGLAGFTESVLSSLRPQCTEYYRDLTRHARRKRDKGTSMRNPSQSLPKLGWIYRYEYKLGIFAELRNEMDVAERHHAAAWDALCDSQGPFESLSSWSPRWDEARMLSDAASIRLIRCQLSIGLPNSAVKTWRNHLRKMHDLVSRKGKGLLSYGWQAWYSRWARVMATLVTDSGIFKEGRKSMDEESDTRDEVSKWVYAARERFVQPDQALDPWEYLHHVGYWYLLSSVHTKKRRELALAIPEEDRVPPGQSPASQVARRYEAYDTYLCLHPHEEYQHENGEENVHSLELISTLGAGAREFSDRDQHRMADYLRVELCRELMRMGKHREAASLLKPMWKRNRWRPGSWNPLTREIAIVLHECATALGNGTLQIATLWELSSSGNSNILHHSPSESQYMLFLTHINLRVWHSLSDRKIDGTPRVVSSVLVKG